ncbi:Glyoxalase/Bleomycin resistance protein/Dihydroxybiphenyl dioxygenase [Geopyxis carbonaria]|nr:Glyoxalase/Bleomycin resistance protein/Dihydroxybiphenyl dioxygenase [Geopyxis carbonaria]
MTSDFTPGEHVLGADPPPPPETAGFRLNHLMLRIKDPARSLRFYKEGFGMRTVFTFNTGLWTIYYLGHPDTPEEQGPEMIATLGQRKGLLELYHIPHDATPAYASGNEPGNYGFGHVGFTVPDVAVALERLLRVCPGTEVVKGLGGDGFGTMGVPVPEGMGEREAGERVEEGYKAVFRQLAFVRDPDGYVVELVPQKVK